MQFYLFIYFAYKSKFMKEKVARSPALKILLVITFLIQVLCVPKHSSALNYYNKTKKNT